MPRHSGFLNYDLGITTRLYSHETGVNTGLPYAHLAAWALPSPPKSEQPAHFTIDLSSEQFRIRSDYPDDWADVSAAAYEALKARGEDVENSELLIRVTSWDPILVRLSVEPAEYDDQRRSNLVLDFRLASRPTLREMLSKQYGRRFPRLDDDRLANTLGVAGMVVVQRGRALKAYCVKRPTTGVSVSEDTWSCTASGAVKWTASTSPTAFPNLALEMLKEMEEEVGLKPFDLDLFAPVTLSREVLRGGKPELLFLATCALDDMALGERRKQALNLASRRHQAIEIVEDSFLRSEVLFVDLEAEPSTFFGDDISHQATGLLLEAANRVDDLRRWFEYRDAAV